MNTVAEKLRTIGVLPVLNVKKVESAEPLAQALINGGLPAIEVLFRNENAIAVMQTMKKNHPEMVVGAGTILTLDQCKTAIDAGADFIVCPGYVQSLVDYCNEKGVLIVPGCSTASEIQVAYNSGLRVVKFFPAELQGGLNMIKQVGSAFSGMKFVPTNGINMDNFASYLKEECIAAVGGSFMAPADLVDKGDWAAIEARCKLAVERAMGFTLAHVGVNADGEDDATRIATEFSDLFMFPVLPKSKSVFAGAAVECMKLNGRGAKGHIGIRTNDVDRAVAYLKKKGIGVIPETAGYTASGALAYIYLDVEVAGFALHLVK